MDQTSDQIARALGSGLVRWLPGFVAVKQPGEELGVAYCALLGCRSIIVANALADDPLARRRALCAGVHFATVQTLDSKAEGFPRLNTHIRIEIRSIRSSNQLTAAFHARLHHASVDVFLLAFVGYAPRTSNRHAPPFLDN